MRVGGDGHVINKLTARLVSGVRLEQRGNLLGFDLKRVGRKGLDGNWSELLGGIMASAHPMRAWCRVLVARFVVWLPMEEVPPIGRFVVTKNARISTSGHVADLGEAVRVPHRRDPGHVLLAAVQRACLERKLLMVRGVQELAARSRRLGRVVAVVVVVIVIIIILLLGLHPGLPVERAVRRELERDRGALARDALAALVSGLLALLLELVLALLVLRARAARLAVYQVFYCCEVLELEAALAAVLELIFHRGSPRAAAGAAGVG